ncbi:MAG: hypothetical protein ACI9V1_000573 [Spirosomataceae bacterium]|jgi:hypothetical protein
MGTTNQVVSLRLILSALTLFCSRELLHSTVEFFNLPAVFFFCSATKAFTFSLKSLEIIHSMRPFGVATLKNLTLKGIF